METLLYYLVYGLVAIIRTLPLRLAARVGRAGGALGYLIDKRHRRVALANLAKVFPQKNPAEIRALARENFRRLGENYVCAVKTAGMSLEQLRGHLEFAGYEPLLASLRPRSNVIAAIGHFGNFELYSHFGEVSGRTAITTYRGIRQKALDALLKKLRSTSGCLYFERRTEFFKMRAELAKGGAMLGLLADQHAGHRAVMLPFLGHECATTTAPALLAQRYRCPLVTAICYRTGLAQWRVEIGPEIPTRLDGRPRPLADIMLEVNAALEKAVWRDPANWFWVHRRWKPKTERKASAPTP